MPILLIWAAAASVGAIFVGGAKLVKWFKRKK
jgi:hypothetical protein